MLKDITLGQYYPSNSIIHKLDPRVKLFGTFAFIVSLFLGMNAIMYVISAIFLFAMIKVSKVPVKYMLKGIKAIVVIIIFTVGFHIFFTKGTPLITIWKITITKEGLTNAVFMFIRLLFLIMGSSLMTLTTTPNDLTDGLEKSLGFLKKIKVPVHEFAMIMSIALRFIPILTEETDKIMKAQMARGADFETGGLIKKAKAMVPLLVPLFISAFRRANDLATAIEARCYNGGEGRTKMKPLKYKERDGYAYLIIFAYLAILIAVRIIVKM